MGKGILESKTIYGIMAGVIARLALARLGIEFSDDDTARLAVILATVAGLGGDCWAFYGRIVAKKKIGPTGGGLAAVFLPLLAGMVLLAGCAGTGGGGVSEKFCLTAATQAHMAVLTGAESAGRLYGGGVIDREATEKALAILTASNKAAEAGGRLCRKDARTAMNYVGEAVGLMIEFNALAGATVEDSDGS